MFKGKTYNTILKELYGLHRLGMRTALGPTRRFLALLGNPQAKFPCIHVAGTNGKGSTVAMIAATLKEAGYRTGAYYSPHITDYRERFLLDGRFFPKTEIVETLRWMGSRYPNRRNPEPLTFFEWSTALAFCLLARAKVDAAVLETGMGGRFDATSVVMPEVAVITNVSLEHTKILGRTIKEIAAEKAGIIKRGVPVVCGDSSPAVTEVVRRIARQKGAKAYFLGEDFHIGKDGAFTGVRGERLELAPSMAGGYQYKNAAVAAQALLLLGGADKKSDSAERCSAFLTSRILRRCECNLVRVSPGGRKQLNPLSITLEHIEYGIAKAFLPGRFEQTRVRGREVIFDVAHNPAAIRELCRTLRTHGETFDFVVGILSDKDARTMLKTLAPLARTIYCITPSDERATPAERLAQTARSLGIRAVALKSAKDFPSRGKGPLVVTGSFTTVEAVKKALNLTA